MSSPQRARRNWRRRYISPVVLDVFSLLLQSVKTAPLSAYTLADNSTQTARATPKGSLCLLCAEIMFRPSQNRAASSLFKSFLQIRMLYIHIYKNQINFLSFSYPSAGAFHIIPITIAPTAPNRIATGNTESQPPASAIAPNITPETTELK